MTEQENQVRREQERRTEVKQLFMEQLKVDEDVAAVYLDHTHYNLERALERYQLENSTTTEPLNTRSKASYVARKNAFFAFLPSLAFNESLTQFFGKNNHSSREEVSLYSQMGSNSHRRMVLGAQ